MPLSLPTPPLAGGKGLSVHSLPLFPCTFSSPPWARTFQQMSFWMVWMYCKEAIGVQGGRQYLWQLCTILQLDATKVPGKPVVVASSRGVQALAVAEKQVRWGGKTDMAARSGILGLIHSSDWRSHWGDFITQCISFLICMGRITALSSFIKPRW